MLASHTAQPVVAEALLDFRFLSTLLSLCSFDPRATREIYTRHRTEFHGYAVAIAIVVLPPRC